MSQFQSNPICHCKHSIICFTLHSLDVVYLYPVLPIIYPHHLSYSHDCVYSLRFVGAVTENRGQAACSSGSYCHLLACGTGVNQAMGTKGPGQHLTTLQSILMKTSRPREDRRLVQGHTTH